MQRSHFLNTAFVSVCIGFVLFTTTAHAGDQEPKQDAKPTLEEAFRKWDMGFSSDKKDERIHVLRSMLPTKKELEHLFPKNADKLWPKFEEGRKFAEENIDLVAKEIIKGGAVTKIKPIDVRADKGKATGAFKELLAIIPKDVHAFELVVSRENSTSGSGTYFSIKDRWFWIKDCESLPAILDKLK